MTDVLGRSWQMGTIQLDYQMPMQFGLTYMGADNREHHPVVIHRALLGSLERFIGILIEHYGGAFPFWLAPVQVRVIPVGEGHREAAEEVAGRLREAGFRVEVDERDETVGQADPRRRAGEGPEGDRLRRQGVRRVAVDPRPRRRAVPGGARGLRLRVSLLRVCHACRGSRASEEREDPESRGGPVPHLGEPPLRPGFNREDSGNDSGRCLQRFLLFERRINRAW